MGRNGSWLYLYQYKSVINDNTITISRSQVEVLPNFAMTDYASQGKTRQNNVVDLSHCRSHQAYYTALSRSASAEGTIILQNFEEMKITGKASGDLRQEFRELELLDEITKLHYNDSLPCHIQAHTRNSLIQLYRKYKGYSYVPPSVHPSLRWNDVDPLLEHIQDLPTLSKQQNLEISKKYQTTSSFIPAKGTKALTNLKRKKDEAHVDEKKPKKLCKNHTPTKHIAPSTSTIHIQPTVAPTSTALREQFTWHQNSCAYDSFFSILYALWWTDEARWTHELGEINHEF